LRVIRIKVKSDVVIVPKDLLLRNNSNVDSASILGAS